METKTCKNCKKLMIKEEHSHWNTRKFCSKYCKKEFWGMEKRKIKKISTFGVGQHNKIVLILNSIIRGKLIVPHTYQKGHYEPDLIKEDIEFELECLGRDRAIKHRKKRKKHRFDGKVPKKRVLVISIKNGLKKLFDEIYLYESKKSMEEFNEKYGKK